MENKLSKENLDRFLSKVLYDEFDRIKPMCLTNNIKNYKLEKFIQEPKVIKYKFNVDEYHFIISFSDSENDIKYNLEVIYPDEPDFIYSMPFVSEKFVQDYLEKLYKKIAWEVEDQKEQALNDFSTRIIHA